MRGIELEISDRSEYNPLLLLNYIGVENFVWHMPEGGFLVDNKHKDADELPEKEIYTRSELMQLINNKSYYAVLFANLRAFFPGTEITEPKTYEEYMKSDCFLVFLVCDCYYVEIYCKDEDFIKKIYQVYKSITEIESIEFKTDENDGRDILYVDYKLVD